MSLSNYLHPSISTLSAVATWPYTGLPGTPPNSRILAEMWLLPWKVVRLQPYWWLQPCWVTHSSSRLTPIGHIGHCNCKCQPRACIHTITCPTACPGDTLQSRSSHGHGQMYFKHLTHRALDSTYAVQGRKHHIVKHSSPPPSTLISLHCTESRFMPCNNSIVSR